MFVVFSEGGGVRGVTHNDTVTPGHVLCVCTGRTGAGYTVGNDPVPLGVSQVDTDKLRENKSDDSRVEWGGMGGRGSEVRETDASVPVT